MGYPIKRYTSYQHNNYFENTYNPITSHITLDVAVLKGGVQ
nr:MAG TPA: hypothetical protein [Caudoviricetes sp.]